MQTSSLSASVPAVRRPPTPLALLDLSKPGERSVHEFICRATSGSTPLFRVLSMRRRGSSLLVAMESAQGSAFVLSLSLVGQAMSLRQCLSHREAIESIGSDVPSMDEFGTLLRDRRERAGMSREELADLARLSIGTLRNLETGRVGAPHRWTLASLLRVGVLGLSKEELPPCRKYRRVPRVGGGA